MILKLNEEEFIDTNNPIDISISLHNGENPVLAWYCEPIKIEAVMTDQFIGDVNKGGSVNFRNIALNPHGNGTHTECVGHISKEEYSINKCLKEYHFMATVISVTPKEEFIERYDNVDGIVTRKILEDACSPFRKEIESSKALAIRTMPNDLIKLNTNYSNSNPVYYTKEAIDYINELKIEHLLVDLPSIDREEDGGDLIGHHTFWNYPDNPLTQKTITELIFIPDEVEDGLYVMNIQITSLENDASPSKVVLFGIQSS
jgi:kynurenine formamidase